MTNPKKRAEHTTVRLLLETLQKTRSTNFCTVTMHSNFMHIRKYLTRMEKQELIEKRPRKSYKITPKGRKLLKLLNKVAKLWI